MPGVSRLHDRKTRSQRDDMALGALLIIQLCRGLAEYKFVDILEVDVELAAKRAAGNAPPPKRSEDGRQDTRHERLEHMIGWAGIFDGAGSEVAELPVGQFAELMKPPSTRRRGHTPMPAFDRYLII